VGSQSQQEFARRLVCDQDRVFRYIVSLVARRADAEEIFQQTCLTLWEQWDRFDPTLDFLPWACGIAHNHTRNFRRKMENQQVMLDQSVMEQLSERHEERLCHTGNDRRSALLACLRRLPEEQRAILDAYYSQCETIDQIARRTASTPNAIYKLLGRVRTALRACIHRRIAGETES
jgi:RNA polymerase sigma-70 factor (ECF subfamily)